MITQIIVFRDENGKVVNIGEWDSMEVEHDDGSIIANNPLPPEYTSQIEDVWLGEDGSLTAVNP